MADRSDIVTLTITKYKDEGWPLTKVLGKWFRTPLAIRKLGQGRYAIDTYKGLSLICEFWYVKNKQ